MASYTGKDKRIKYLFENGGGGGGGASALSQLSDVELTNLTNDQILIYQASLSKWVNKDGGGSGSKIKTVTKSMTSNGSGYFLGFTDENGNALNPDEYILFDISATTSSQYYLGLPFVLSGNYLARMQLSLVPSYVEYVKTAITLNVRYSYMKKSGGVLCLGDIYSTEERQVGVYIDGKPLYQKTVNMGTLATQNYKSVLFADVGISNLEHVAYIDIVINDTYSVNFNRPDNVNTEFYSQLTATGIFLRAYNTAVTRAIATIQYTKTTDTAGNGIWTPSGGYAVHYSTDEQVIGTWIDGDTLYRRTITGLSLALNGANWVNYTAVSNIKKLIHLDAYYEATDGRLLHCSIAEFQSLANGGLQLCATSSTFNRTINVMTIEYTKSA